MSTLRARSVTSPLGSRSITGSLRSRIFQPYMWPSATPKLDLGGCVFYAPLYNTRLADSPFTSLDIYGHICTVTGAVWGTQGRRFTPAPDDYITIDAALVPLASSTKGTWMIGVMLDVATPVGSPNLICFGDTNAAEMIWIEIIAATGIFRAGVYDASVEKWILSTNAVALSDGVYAHLAVIQDGVSPVLLVNGVPVAQTFTSSADKTSWFSVCTGLDNGRLGCRNWNNAGNASYIRNGNVGEVVLSNRVYTIPEVQNHILATKWRYT